MPRDKLYEICEKCLVEEFHNTGTDWRIFGLTTFSDLIHAASIDLKNSNFEKEHCLRIINLSIKALIQKELGLIELTGNYQIDTQQITFPLNELKEKYKCIWYKHYLEMNETSENLDTYLGEIIDYSLYHKKDIVSNTNSYFNLILSNGLKILKRIINE
ncbi:MAG: hypothetical protein OIF50_10140 [Flavobacteriaceae bacterium]|nr:hypothetical protein [Flavobacteriaceae bacterium]